ncbi:endonuclease/exonuclease/phosphatase family protein [Nisaea acidiphila]|uniref:Endonuclease/exonuclease/phosphatase family protein n=1 Tax=Nisaea acidiphila TaxID=1862145 RepID=A0A9J7AXR7_9PROT|nr:endonuclease/exonuclease/phosphatase family protein [Nisaea acidiphila]UUX52080.1 endonuclease/exonuclease/phosphatase family protein [Nisaea acidiphila]
MDSLRRYSIICSWAIAAALIAGLFGAFHPLADSFAHFRLHLLVLALPFLLLLLITRAWINALAIAAVVVVGAGSLGQLFGGGAFAANGSDDAQRLRIVSLNLHHFYTDPERVTAFMEEAAPGVVAFQEAGLEPPKITERLRAIYPHQLICRYRGDVGIAVLSRTPFKGTGCLDDHRLAWATVEQDGRPVTVASLHLRWPFPSPQAAQIGGLSTVWEQLDTPLVITGDFNAAPWSHAVQKVARDSGTRVVPGLRRSFTWGDNWLGDLMALPIDHALVSPTLKIAGAELGPHVSSDHLPLIVDVETRRF